MSKRVKAGRASDPSSSPPKKPRTAVVKASSSSNVSSKLVKPKPRIAPNGYRLPDPLPAGEVLTDSLKGLWVIGQTIGSGGFGEIYTARPIADKTENWNYVVKIDHKTGPLYAEMNFYLRVAKEDSIRNWMRNNRLLFLGMPRFIANGIHVSTGSEYRFLVMQRFGSDLQKKLGEVNNTFDVKTSYTIASKVIDILEYIHSFGYIHADIKASNLLLGRFQAPTPNGKGINEVQGIHTEVWLVDFGLVERYMTQDGKHKPDEEDQRRANNGTVEFTSRDAHIGALARRSDLEILAFNVLSWLSGGRLPWMSNLKDQKYVYECKCYYMDRLHELFNYAFSKPGGTEIPTPPKVDFKTAKRAPNMILDKGKLKKDLPPGIQEFFQYIVSLDFEQKPDYGLMKAILANAVSKVDEDGYDGKFSFNVKPPVKNGRGREPSKVSKVASKLKRSSLSSPGPRKALQYSDNEEEAMDVDKPARGRKLRERKESPEKKASKAPKAGKKPSQAKGRSSTVDRKQVPSLSEPSSMTPSKSGATSDSPSKSPYSNPTPAMLELMARIKEKHRKKSPASANRTVAQKLVYSAAVTANKTKLKPVGVNKNQVVAAPANGDADLAIKKEAPVIEVVKKRPVGRPPKSQSIERKPVVAKQLSSNSSTHSTKENKYTTTPTRRSPRGAKN